MRQIPKFSLRRIFHGSASQQNMEYLSTSFMSGDRETEDELYSIWNGLPESIGRPACFFLCLRLQYISA